MRQPALHPSKSGREAAKETRSAFGARLEAGQGSAVPVVVAERSASDNEAGSQRSAVLTGTQIRETTAEKGHCAFQAFHSFS